MKADIDEKNEQTAAILKMQATQLAELEVLYKEEQALRKRYFNVIEDLMKAVPDDHKKFLAGMVWVHEEAYILELYQDTLVDLSSPKGAKRSKLNIKKDYWSKRSKRSKRSKAYILELNVWSPKVANPYEFSLSQMWVISGSFGDDLSTIEAGWQVSPELYGDNYPRFFTYWTTDAYQATGCYNLLRSGFVQTNSKIAIGAAISFDSFNCH